MSTDRRSFLQWAGAAASAIGLGSFPNLGHAAMPGARGMRARPVGRAPEPLSILVIGGTGFTGPEQVEFALARGHRVTVINRNRTRPDFFKGEARVEQLIGVAAQGPQELAIEEPGRHAIHAPLVGEALEAHAPPRMPRLQSRLRP